MAYAGAIVDLDGTVYRGDSLLPGARTGISRLRDAGIAILFLSNKAIYRASHYVSLLSDLGIQVEESEVVNSSLVTARFLSERHPNRTVFVVGEEPLIEELRASGLSVTRDPATADVIVASMDREFDYTTLHRVLEAMDDNTLFIATNADRTCPVEDGEIPDAGGMIGAIEGVTGRTVDYVMGKPSPYTIEMATERLGATPVECLMIGDRLETDIKMGEQAGMTTVLVLTGVTDEADLTDESLTPDHVIPTLGDIGRVIDG